ncbi:unnamed protein product [Ectocarpus sp. CCAP 1310/34]|nr:unnamed protein product [Ectocarpus sp. CCAP 1310/34]
MKTDGWMLACFLVHYSHYERGVAFPYESVSLAWTYLKLSKNAAAFSPPAYFGTFSVSAREQLNPCGEGVSSLAQYQLGGQHGGVSPVAQHQLGGQQRGVKGGQQAGVVSSLAQYQLGGQ